ncbi:MAG: FtsX-like permease family protein [Anaerolineae bacterium]|jgi:putative ABC transport system permease protein|nr:FtsX-like permease family protein [Anaerolineae bacterium]MBT7325597.1 FtsX-like permease family protein [Anaerolineae bacterium]
MKEINLFALALQNLRRKPYRTIVIGLCVAVATGSLFAATIVLRGVQHSLTVGRARLGADLVIVPDGYETLAQEAFITGQPSTFYMSDVAEKKISTLSGVNQTSPQVFVETLSNASCCIGEFFLVGFDPETDFTISPWLTTHLDGKALGPFDIIVGDRILLREGETVIFYGTEFSVVGVLEKTGMGIDRTIYVPMEGLRSMIANSETLAEQTLEISPKDLSSIMVSVKPDAEILDVAELIEANLDGVNVFTATQLNQAVGNQLQGVLGITFGVTASLWLMSLFTIGLVFSLIVNERQRELGILRAMGARRKVIFQLVMGEAGLLTGLGGLGGLVAAGVLLTGFSRLIQLRLRIPYLLPNVFEIMGISLLLLLLALFTGALASLHPALSSSKMEPYAAIRKGE